MVLRQLRQLIGRERVGDLLAGDLKRQSAAAAAERVPLVVVGGDGSAASVLNSVVQRKLRVPVAVLPLGTGNDLARYLGMGRWSLEELPQALESLRCCRSRLLDRWVLHGPDLHRWWFNYCSFGADARVCMSFDRLRRRHPQLFVSASVNKAWYGLLGLLDRRRPLTNELRSPLINGSACSVESLVFANINSYAGGTRLHPDIDAADGLLDVVALPGGWSVLPYLQQWRQAAQLACTDGTWVTLRRAGHVQVDGEPFVSRAGVYRIEPAGKVTVLARSLSTTTVHARRHEPPFGSPSPCVCASWSSV